MNLPPRNQDHCSRRWLQAQPSARLVVVLGASQFLIRVWVTNLPCSPQGSRGLHCRLSLRLISRCFCTKSCKIQNISPPPLKSRKSIQHKWWGCRSRARTPLTESEITVCIHSYINNEHSPARRMLPLFSPDAHCFKQPPKCDDVLYCTGHTYGTRQRLGRPLQCTLSRECECRYN